MEFIFESKNRVCDGAIENCMFGGHLAILAKLNLLANKSIYWSKGCLASESEQILVIFGFGFVWYLSAAYCRETR